MKRQRGQTTVFFALILTGLLLLTAVGIDIGRIVYARGEVGKSADAAALSAASRINMALYRETGEIQFLPDAYTTAQSYASMNSAFLQRRHIGVAVTGISVDLSTRVVSVSVAADLSSLIPGILPFEGGYMPSREKPRRKLTGGRRLSRLFFTKECHRFFYRFLITPYHLKCFFEYS